ncbi:MAG: putative 4-hydroxybenzoate polyprenyltransferase [Armatimonadota bacterium]|nr:putative 4-hydroxybenzoate polyprenyltransferase [Armatimonadota bacterium]
MNDSLIASPRPTLRDYLELVKFSHTIFALPFALASMLIAAKGWPAPHIILWILGAMVTARTAAMGFNRIVDRHIDAANPRTSGREIPSGKISVGQASALVALSAALFVFCAYQLNTLAFALALPTLAVLFFYSFCKRFTAWSHLVLGFCLGIAPIGAWIAVRAQLEVPPIVLGAAIMFWVAGFDIIYATMDEEFDRKAGLHSMVQKLGTPAALMLARVFHLIFSGLLFLFGRLAALGGIYMAAVALIALFLVYEHAIVNPRDLRRVNAAFFTVNGAISVFFLIVVAVEVFQAGGVY